MADPVLDLCNRALGAAGARGTIASLSDGTNKAALCQQFYTSSLQAVLVRGRWNFALTTATAVAVAGTPSLPPQWTYAYQYPADCLQMRSVQAPALTGTSVPIFGAALASLQSGPSVGVQFALVNLGGVRAILCNQQGALINYTTNVVDLTQWEPQALVALEMLLASRIAIPLSGDKTLAKGLAEQAEAAMQTALMANANEDTSVQDVPTDWLIARSYDTFPCIPPSNN